MDMQLHETTGDWVISPVTLTTNDWLVTAALSPLPSIRRRDWLRIQLAKINYRGVSIQEGGLENPARG